MINFAFYKKNILSKRMFLNWCGDFLKIIGLGAVAFTIFAAVYPDSLKGNSALLVILFIAAGFAATWRTFPKKSLSVFISASEAKIKILVGDLFKQPENLVIGFCDTFDTELGEIISTSSIQGQFLSKEYANDQPRLDRELEDALSDELFSADESTTHGKRYPIGTTVVLSGTGGRKFFCCAYSKMGDNHTVSAEIKDLWDALQSLWIKVREKGERRPVAIAVVGSQLARIPNGSHSLLIKLIVLSFIISSRIRPVADELKIVIAEKDAQKIEFSELKSFINSLK